MARFLVGTVPVFGHVNPATSIVQKLTERGHEVWWYTGRVFQPMVEATGAKFVPMVNSLDYSDTKNVPQSLIEERSSLQGIAQLKFDLKHFFIDAALGQVQDYTNLLAEFPADVMLGDSFFLGASWVSEQRGIPWAQFGISVLAMSSLDTAPFGLGLQLSATTLGRLRNSSLNWLLQNMLFRDILTYTNKLRASIQLLPTSKNFFDVISPFLYLAGTVPAFEYPRCDLPPQVHFVGPFLPKSSAEFTPPSWWEDLKTEQPVVHVTQGKQYNKF